MKQKDKKKDPSEWPLGDYILDVPDKKAHTCFMDGIKTLHQAVIHFSDSIVIPNSSPPHVDWPNVEKHASKTKERLVAVCFIPFDHFRMGLHVFYHGTIR
jgi:hypothetical protein